MDTVKSLLSKLVPASVTTKPKCEKCQQQGPPTNMGPIKNYYPNDWKYQEPIDITTQMVVGNDIKKIMNVNSDVIGLNHGNYSNYNAIASLKTHVDLTDIKQYYKKNNAPWKPIDTLNNISPKVPLYKENEKENFSSCSACRTTKHVSLVK